MQWVKDLPLLNMNFEMDFKMVVDSVYGGSNGFSSYMVIINDCRHMLATDDELRLEVHSKTSKRGSL